MPAPDRVDSLYQTGTTGKRCNCPFPDDSADDPAYSDDWYSCHCCGVWGCPSGKKRGGAFILACMCVLVVIWVMDVISYVRIQTAQVQKSQITYGAVTPGEGRDGYTLCLAKDNSDAFDMEQCRIFCDESSPFRGTAVVYLNYGGWKVQDETFGSQMKELCEQEGYTFVRFGVAADEGGKLPGLMRNIEDRLSRLLKEESFEKVFLCGGSAGGHLALLCAENMEHVSGVIALYPFLNPGYTYDYFVDREEESYGMLGKLGDYIYCSLYDGDTGTLAHAGIHCTGKHGYDDSCRGCRSLF